MKMYIVLICACFAVLSSCSGGSGGNNPGGGPVKVQDDDGVYAPPVNVPAAPEYDDNGIHVSTTGSDDTGDGTESNPYKTIAHALKKFDEKGSGGTIILHGGVYLEQVRISLPNITIRSKSDEWAVIKVQHKEEYPGEVIRIDPDSHNCTLQRLEIIGGGYYCVNLETKWEWGDPADRSGVSNVTIEDCKIRKSGRDCIKIQPNNDDVTIRRCEISDSGLRDSENAEGIDNVNGDRTLVQDCYIHDIATNGVYFKGGATNCTAERLIIENVGGAGILLGFDTSPEFFDLTVNPDYYECINGVARNCLVINTNYSGIGMFSSQNPKVYNNTIINASKISHSPIYFGTPMQEHDPDAKRPPSLNPEIRNNLVWQSSAITNMSMIHIRYSDEMGGIRALEGYPAMSNNCYYREDGKAGVFSDARLGMEMEGVLSDWKEHISSDTDSFEVNPMIDAAYKLVSGSPCIGKARPLAEVSLDQSGKSRDSQPDIGAYEL